MSKNKLSELSEQKLIDAGYKMFPNLHKGVFVYDRLYQKRSKKGYYIDIQAYDFPDGIMFQPHVQFCLPDAGEAFNVDLIANWDLDAIERFFDNVFNNIGRLGD